ncbi:Pho80p cyclin [Entomophthora muscae]|uniref:Pho80p cyclin n=1 Tax=Entomophthora muscae TaxID=34485 RepID=A0ACC2RG55_9FUNG|nr:Pho80p cyclin [Entomophthora muscae]
MNTTTEFKYPHTYYTVEPRRIVELIAELLSELATRNDSNPAAVASLTRFHSRAVPKISILDYLNRIVKFSPIENEVLLAALVYIDRLCSYNPTFAITSLSIHRYLITAITVGSKVFCDSYWTNTQYAKLGGITLQELNILELEFSFLIRWDLVITPNKSPNFHLEESAAPEDSIKGLDSYDFLIIGLLLP